MKKYNSQYYTRTCGQDNKKEEEDDICSHDAAALFCCV